jgi:hypothetical protein
MVIQAHSTAKVRLRRKNQVTVPDAVLTEIGAAVGDAFLVSVEDGAIRMERVLPSYAGALAGVYPPNWAAELREDRNRWRE